MSVPELASSLHPAPLRQQIGRLACLGAAVVAHVAMAAAEFDALPRPV